MLRLVLLALSLTAFAASAEESAPSPEVLPDAAPGPEAPEAEAPTAAEPMTLARMAEIVFAIDENAQSRGSNFRFTIDDVPVFIVSDPAADRMRAMSPIRPVDGLSPGEMARMMQANFDTALDARYAVAQETLWAVFIHPLSPLEKDQLVSGIAQTVNLVKTYGTLYSGGAINYRGGDSPGLQRELIEDLLERTEPI